MGTMASPSTSITIVYSSVYSGADQIKHQSSVSLAFVRGIHRWQVNSPHKGPVTRKMLPFDGVMECQFSYDSLCSGDAIWRHMTRHQMGTFSTLLTLCAGNSPVTSEFPSQRPVTRSFDVFFNIRLNKRLSKQSWGWWLERTSRSLKTSLECCLSLNMLSWSRR